MITTGGLPLNPGFRLFLVHLLLITQIDEEALTRWMVMHCRHLKAGFVPSGEQLDRRVWDEIAVWVREQYMTSITGGCPL